MKRTADEQIDIEYRRQQLVEKAVRAADAIILDGSDGSNEETDFLTSEVALRFAEKAAITHRMAMLKKDMEL